LDLIQRLNGEHLAAETDTHPERAYNLSDSIALRNALRCT